jgi:signal transduction histidine kinase
MDSIIQQYSNPIETALREKALAGFWTYDPAANHLMIGDNLANLLGIEPTATLTLDSLRAKLHDDDLDSFDTFIHQLHQKSETSYIEIRYCNTSKSKEWRWIYCYAEHLGEFGRIIGFFKDVLSERMLMINQRIKNTLHNEVEKISSSGGFDWVLNDDFLTCSDNFFRITNTTNKNKSNRLDKSDFFDLIDENRKNFVLEVMHDSITNNQEFEVTFSLPGAGDKRVKLFGYPEGDIRYKRMIGVIIDISNQTNSRKALIRGQDSERKRISLEIHDSVGQKLVAIKYKLAFLKMSKNFENFDELNISMDEIIEEIRGITHNLSTEIVTEVGLKNAIGQVLNESAKVIDAKKYLDFNIPDELHLTEEQAKMIYRITQESLSNAMKHSNATELSVSVRYINQQLAIEVVDNGDGFLVGDTKKEGIGLQNIRERVSYLSGFLKIESEKGKGTAVKIRIPILDNGKN